MVKTMRLSDEKITFKDLDIEKFMANVGFYQR
jgi:hypothetical protein